jgi:hypothetical protein
MLFYTEIPETSSYTEITVAVPVRLACFSYAGFARGIYYVEGDLRGKLVKPHDRRLLQGGLVSLTYVGKEDQQTAHVEEAPPPMTIVEPAPIRPALEAQYDLTVPYAPSEEKPKRRGRPRKAQLVATVSPEAKLPSYDENSASTSCLIAEADETSSVYEGSPPSVA